MPVWKKGTGPLGRGWNRFVRNVTLAGVLGLLVPWGGAWAAPAAEPPEAMETHAESLSCHAVLRGIETRFIGYDSWRVLRYTIRDGRGAEKIRRAVIAHKNEGMRRKMRSLLLEPEEMAGFEAIAYDYYEDGLSDRLWTWLPSIGKVHAMKSEDLSGRMYGSETGIGEMMLRRDKDYDCTSMGEGVYRGLPVWKIWVNPRTEAERIRLGLNDGEVWVTKGSLYPVWSTFNTNAASEQREFSTDRFHVVDGVFAPTYYESYTRKEGHVISSTVTEVEVERYSLGLPDGWFEVEDLGAKDSGWRDFAPPPPRHR